MRNALVAFFIFIGFVAGCAPTREPSMSASNGSINLTTTILPLQNIILAITDGVTGVRINQLLPATAACPHDYQLSPGDLKTLETSRVLFAVGRGYEPFLPKIAENYQKQLSIVSLTEAIPPLLVDSESESHQEAEHRHEDGGHPFVSPKQAVVMVEAAVMALCQTDPAHAESYQTNGMFLQAALKAIHDELAVFVQSLPNKRVVEGSSIFSYLVHDIGLESDGVLTDPHHGELTAGAFAALTKKLRTRHPAAILVERQVDSRSTKMAAAELHVSTIELTTGLAGTAGPAMFLQNMRQLAAELKAGLQGKNQ